MSYTFSLPFDANSVDLIEKAKIKVSNNGGSINGNHIKGNVYIEKPFEIEGNYEINKNEITFTITKKPRLLPNKLIKDYIKKQL